MKRIHLLFVATYLAITLLHFVVAANSAVASDSWSSFQNGGEVEVSAANVPTEWTPSSVAWKKELAGYGQSSPVIDGSRIYVTSTSGDMKENLFVEAFDKTSGKRLWVHEAKNSSPAKNTTYVSRAAPTPVCDSSGVIALFEGGNIVALDRDGQPRWSRDLPAEFGAISSRHGLGSSLEHDDARVFAWIERDEDPFVMALSKETGETIWKVSGLGVTSWSSPRLVPVDNGKQLVLSGSGKIAGIDPRTGERLWEFEEISGNSTPTPVPLGGGKFLIGASEGRGETGGGNAAASNGVIRISKDAQGKFTVDFVWQAKKATSSFSSPVAHQGHAYFVNRAGVVYCLDIETGEERYAERSSGSVWATPFAVEDRLYLFCKDGTTTVVRSGSKFEQLAENNLWIAKEQGESDNSTGNFGGPVLYAAVAVDSQLILRRGDILYAVGTISSN